jgi:SSS family solute:Na+ symporter
MHVLDWAIVFALFGFIVIMAVNTRRHTKSVADFLAANRCAGKYLIAVSEGLATTGAIGLIAMFEMFYEAGFGAMWWNFMMLPVGTIIILSGWVIYRFRQTRAMTIAQFYEIRYSKRFRIFAGIVSFVSGILNFGIFPAIGARFFMHFCGLPQVIPLAGIAVPLYPVLMAVLLGSALFLTFMGGQIAVITTDFFQGLFTYAAMVFIVAVVLVKFSWPQIVGACLTAPREASLFDPVHTTQIPNFNVWYFLIGIFSMFFTYMSWQGTQGFNCSAKSPHEARMGKILGNWKGTSQWVFVLILPIAAYTVLHNGDFSEQAGRINSALGNIANDEIRKQVTIPVTLAHILPQGAMGMLCAIMLAAFIANHNASLHSWASIFVQDVVLPFRKEPLSARQHLIMLRGAIIGVAIFIYIFSLCFQQTQSILLYFAVTGAIYMGGAGAVIIGGLYWKRGTTAAAWSSMIAGSTLSVSGLLLEQAWPHYFGHKFPINGQWMLFIALIASLSIYTIVSVLCSRNDFDMERMLHRGRYAIDNAQDANSGPKGIMQKLGITAEFSRFDRWIYYSTFVWNFGWFAVFAVGTFYGWCFNVKTLAWIRFWHFFVIFNFVITIGIMIWLTVGGLLDYKNMINMLRASKRDEHDDGTVIRAAETTEFPEKLSEPACARKV